MTSDLSHILRDPAVRDEILAAVQSDDMREDFAFAKANTDNVRREIEGVASGLEGTVSFTTEAIIRRKGRPVLFIQDEVVPKAEMDRKLELELWKTRFADGLPQITPRIPSIGRVELTGHPRFSWVGTGWMVAPRVMVTNRHVAETFARRAEDEYVFRLDPRGRPMRAALDTFEEYQRTSETEFRVQKILHIEDEPGPDMAFLYVAPKDSIEDRDFPPMIDLSEDDPQEGQVVGAIGYAGWDGVRNEEDVMRQIFEGVYEVKRLHPGEVMGIEERGFTHDCSTLGGNSGSVLLDFATGKAVGLHFAGRFEQRNYAVTARDIRNGLERLDL